MALVVCLDSGGDPGCFFSAALVGGGAGTFGRAFALKAAWLKLRWLGLWLTALAKGGRREVGFVVVVVVVYVVESGFMLNLESKGCGYTDISLSLTLRSGLVQE